jgi:hypothetical protein
MLKFLGKLESPSLRGAYLVGVEAAFSDEYDEIMHLQKKSVRSDPFKRVDFLTNFMTREFPGLSNSGSVVPVPITAG